MGEKLLQIALLVSLAIVSVVGVANASFYLDPHLENTVLEAGESTTWTFDLLNDTLYGVNIDDIDLATIDWSSLPFVDIEDGDIIDSAFFSLWIGDDNLFGDASFRLFGKKIWIGDEEEYADVIADGDYLLDDKELNFIDGILAYDVTASMQDYVLSVTVENVSQSGGDFYVGISAVGGEFTTVPNPIPNPEPTTMLLFGFGLLSVAGISRKKTA